MLKNECTLSTRKGNLNVIEKLFFTSRIPYFVLCEHEASATCVAGRSQSDECLDWKGNIRALALSLSDGWLHYADHSSLNDRKRDGHCMKQIICRETSSEKGCVAVRCDFAMRTLLFSYISFNQANVKLNRRLKTMFDYIYK
jgi:hypothetical protein